MSDPKCVARAPVAMTESVEAFHGEANPLSNLHCCPEGCTIPDGQHDFPSVEHHYQFSHLHYYDMDAESFHILEAPSGLEVMKIAHYALPHDQEKLDWKHTAVEEMILTNHLSMSTVLMPGSLFLSPKLSW